MLAIPLSCGMSLVQEAQAGVFGHYRSMMYKWAAAVETGIRTLQQQWIWVLIILTAVIYSQYCIVRWPDLNFEHYL